MGRSWHPSQERVLTALLGRPPTSAASLAALTGLGLKAVQEAVARCWRNGYVLRTESMLSERRNIFRGRSGLNQTLRHYHLYVIPEDECDLLQVGGRRLIKYDPKRDDAKAHENRAALVLRFLQDYPDHAFFSKQVFEALKDKDVKIGDIMTNVRRFERNGFVYVRGYRSHDRETPFKDGFILTRISKDKPRQEALAEAVERTEKVLDGKASSNPLLQRVQRIRDEIVVSTRQRDIVASTFLHEKIGCTEYELQGALERAIQLYPDIVEVKLFNNYRYYHLSSMPAEDVRAAVSMKQNYLRKVKGKDNRVGHNWEAAVDWYIDKNMKAHFWTQKHRTNGMDPRRITLHLLKPVADRQMNAEVDRVMEFTPGPIADPIVYVVSCKWAVVRKFDLDDFFDVLRWSKEFGVTTQDGERKVRQGVIGWFAAGAFDPKSKIRIKGDTISLAAYAERLSIKLLKAADINEKFRARGVDVSVQAVCRAAKNEEEVRELLGWVWETPNAAKETLSEAQMRNRELYEFERMLESAPEKSSSPNGPAQSSAGQGPSRIPPQRVQQEDPRERP